MSWFKTLAVHPRFAAAGPALGLGSRSGVLPKLF